MIYFIQAGKNGPIKIGYTDNDVQSRLNQLQTACPYELKLLWACNGDIEKEGFIQKKFSHENIRGEWFRPSRELIRYIKEEAISIHIFSFGDNKLLIKERMEDYIIHIPDKETMNYLYGFQLHKDNRINKNINFYNFKNDSIQNIRNLSGDGNEKCQR